MTATTAEVVDEFLHRLPIDLCGAVSDLAADDIEWRFPPSLTGGKPWRGKQTVVRRLGRVLTSFEPGSMVLNRTSLALDGERAVVEFDLSARSPNGVAYANSYVFVFVIRDGQLATVHEYMDTAVVLEFLRAAGEGAAPSAGPV